MDRQKTLACGRVVKPTKHARVDAGALAEVLGAHVQAKRLNRSLSRQKILEVLTKLDGHFSAGELAQSVQRAHGNIGAATVYRNLPVFVDAGILRESLSDGSRGVLYELVTPGHHDHVVCLDCNEIFEFHEESIEKTQRKVLGDLKFKEASHKHVIYARCEYKSKGKRG